MFLDVRYFYFTDASLFFVYPEGPSTVISNSLCAETERVEHVGGRMKKMIFVKKKGKQGETDDRKSGDQGNY